MSQDWFGKTIQESEEVKEDIGISVTGLSCIGRLECA